MMRLFCNGIELDLLEEANVQFTQENSLFAFQDLKCERTTSIDLPSTPTNDTALALARIPAAYGNGMRRKFDAQMVFSGLTKSGYLYVSSYDEKGYKAVFVSGGLSKVKNFGNHEWGTLPLPYLVRRTPYSANEANIPMIARVKYHTDATPIYDPYQPSIDVHELFVAINNSNLLKITGLTGQHFRLIRNTPHEVEDAQVVLRNNKQGSTASEMDISSDSPLIGLGSMVVGAPQGEPYATTVAFSPSRNAEITFPENTPPNLCLCIPSDNTYGDGVYINFIGGRGFRKENGNIVYYGTPLAGRTFTIPGSSPYRTVRFVLMTAEAAVWHTGINDPFFYYGSADPQVTGGNWSDVPDYSVYLRVSAASPYGWFFENFELPAVAVLQNLSLGNLIKLYSIITGTLVNETEDGVQFISNTSNKKHEPTIIKFEEVARKFGKFGQRSLVKFKDTNNVQEFERKIVVYTIDNDNLEAEVKLIEFNASEGGIYGTGISAIEDDILLVRGVKNETDDYSDDTDAKLPNDIIAQTGSDEYLKRVALTKSNFIQSLCNTSTSVTVQTRMGVLEYNRIKPDDLLYVDGLLHVWTKREWQNEVAKFTLAKI